jgi:tellurite methyltransferase
MIRRYLPKQTCWSWTAPRRRGTLFPRAACPYRGARTVRHWAPTSPPMTSNPPGYEGRFDAIGWYLMARVFRLKRTLPRDPPWLIDLGTGRGRDILYFARRGFRVVGVDIAPAGIERARRRAARLGVPIRTEVGDLRTYRLKHRFDVVFSSTSLNCLPATARSGRFAHFQASTTVGGIHAVNAFVAGQGLPDPPDVEPSLRPFRPGELRGYYRDWTILESSQLEFPCRFGGRPHHHRVDAVVARRPE